MSLKEVVSGLGGNRLKFMLLRIADMDVETARNLCGVTKHAYNYWLKDDKFVEINRRREELAAEYKKDAIQLLRRQNQLEAVLLEEEIIYKLREEVRTGDLQLVKTHIAREVYSKLINDLDYQPPVQALSWEQRITNLLLPDTPEGEVINEGFTETNSSQTEQHKEGNLLTSGKQEGS